MQQLAGKVAVVTGGGSGIGRALTMALAAEGMHVAVLDYQLDAAIAVAGEGAALGVRALPFAVDVSDRSAMMEAAAQVYAELGGCHVLCNNAGVGVYRTLLDLTDDDWDWILGVNLLGVIHGLQAFVPEMVARGEGGHIVNTSSGWGMVPEDEPGMIAYQTAKYGVVGLSEGLSIELAQHGIGCSLLAPATVRTRILGSSHHRPERFGGPETGDGHIDEETADAVASGMDPAKVAALTLQAIQEGDFYVLTHPELRPLVETRHRRILAALARSAARLGEMRRTTA